MNIYNAFLAKGSNVELPVNTPIFLRVDEKPMSSSLSQPQSGAVLASLRTP
jgi:hypothetical protein